MAATEVTFHRGSSVDENSVQVSIRQGDSTSSQEDSDGKPPPSGRLPRLFERSSGSWMNPRFDSTILEKQLVRSYFPQNKRRFQYALLYIIVSCVAWSIFFAVLMRDHWLAFVIGSVAVLIFCISLLFFTCSRFYTCHTMLVTSLVLSIVLCTLTLATVAYYDYPKSPVSNVGMFAICVEILLMMYTVIPMPLLVAVVLGALYSILYEVLYYINRRAMPNYEFENQQEIIMAVCKIFLHICIHLMGLSIFFMSQVRKHSTFWKVAQSIVARRELEVEKHIKEKMIHSVMPRLLADELMQSTGEEDQDSKKRRSLHGSSPKKKKSQGIFRPFYMNRMDNVSILYADIVGFTKMSSNKTAEQLVGLLNDLFGRFDILAEKNGCEKISTLGDCYYCVSGCPEPRPDHAICCVEMGLQMISTIKEFCQDTNENVNMRVGVHTGTVLCGIIGTRRFKFDVWSNDVTLANMMEAAGLPGKVHVSAATAKFFNDAYNLEEGKGDSRHSSLIGVKTFFIVSRAKQPTPEIKPKSMISGSTSNINKESNDNEKAIKDVKVDIGDTEDTESDASENIDASETDKMVKKDESEVEDKCLKAVSHKSLPTNSANSSPQCGSKVKAVKTLSNHTEMQDMSESKAVNLLKTENGSLGPSRTPSVMDMLAERPNEMQPSFPECILPRVNVTQQSDRQLVKCIQEEESNQEYFFKPPIHDIMLTFIDKDVEDMYRSQYEPSQVQPGPQTISSPKSNTAFDVALAFTVYTLMSIGCFLIFERQLPWLIFFPITWVFEAIILVVVIHDALYTSHVIACAEKVMTFFGRWYSRHFLGAFLISLPVLAVYANFVCPKKEADEANRFYCYMIIVALLHFCNFVQLSSWLKSVVAILSGTVLLVLLNVSVCANMNIDGNNDNNDSNTMAAWINSSKSSLDNTTYSYEDYVTDMNSTETPWNVTDIPLILLNPSLFSGHSQLKDELILDILLLLILVWFLNREFEISYRLNFNGDIEATDDKRKIQVLKEQADWLLHNIIPQHISDLLKKTSKYSKNHVDVGVVFCSVVNFTEFYEENYQGGKECIRVLNELIGDFDQLLDRKKYNTIEKIKTIGSTFMAAAGLHPTNRRDSKHPYMHLILLMDFSVDMQKAVHQFNEEVLNLTMKAFNFVLRVGYNHGEVTAGVIGTTKLLFDIWGDTVNIASRMDSTGVAGRIQVTESSRNVLLPYFEFEERGKTTVKGKGDMMTYLMKEKKNIDF